MIPKRKLIGHCVFLLLFGLQLPDGHGQEESLTAHDVAQGTETRYLGDDVATALEMLLINADGKIRRREFVMYRKEFADGKRTLYKFLYPHDIKDTGTVNREVKGAEDIQHIYLPAARKLRRISAKNQSWMGSDIYYEDLEEADLDENHYELVGSEVVDGQDCYIFAQTPIDPDTSMYGKQIRWVRKVDLVPKRREYYDKKGRLQKIAWMKDWRLVHGVHYAWHSVVMNVEDHHWTIINRRWAFLNTDIPDRMFKTTFLDKSIDFYEHPKDLWDTWNKTLDTSKLHANYLPPSLIKEWNYRALKDFYDQANPVWRKPEEALIQQTHAS